MTDIDSVPSVVSWRPPAPLTVVLSESESNELARKLADDGGWWYFQDRVSVNGIAMELSDEKEWEEGEERVGRGCIRKRDTGGCREGGRVHRILGG